MEKPKYTDILVQDEGEFKAKTRDLKVQSIDRKNGIEVREFSLQPIQAPGSRQYSEIRGKYGPLAATDEDAVKNSQKDRRFSINPLLRNPLSIQEEENRVIEDKVQSIVSEIAEKEKKQAGVLGYQEGFQKGFDEARKKVQVEASQQIQHFDELLKGIEQARFEIFRLNEKILIDLVYKISRMLIMKELSSDRDYLVRLSKEIIGKLGVRENITVKINPKDGDVIGILKDGVEKTFGSLTNFKVEMSSHVKEGGCEVETDWNVIRTHIEDQLQAVYKSMLPEANSQAVSQPKEESSS